MGDTSQPILFCNCSNSDIIPARTKQRVLGALSGSSLEHVVVPDLCRAAARRSPALTALAQRAGGLTVVACHPRAVRWLLHAAGLAWDSARYRVLNMRTRSADAIMAELFGGRPAPVSDPPAVAPEDDDWVPWFPVIDYDRCRNCRQCFNFCLFGAFALSSDGNVQVAEPWNCKNNCPACARICPEAAIMFPKLDEEPINGAEITDEQLVRANVKLNVQELLGDDVYAALGARRRQAKMRLLKKRAIERAEQEREKCVGQGDA
ncbi:MAG: 4Fe-4S dicluster domain-containing protein [Kiritimatiellae bacterium]|nr:4Fe-4S dicluster domain-containing protein [Kiritimatiellia bacterium]